MPTPEELLAIKAKAFDTLMSVIDGKHECVKRYHKPEIGPLMPYHPSVAFESITVKDVFVYEWRFRMKNVTKLKETLMNEAAKDLKVSA